MDGTAARRSKPMGPYSPPRSPGPPCCKSRQIFQFRGQRNVQTDSGILILACILTVHAMAPVLPSFSTSTGAAVPTARRQKEIVFPSYLPSLPRPLPGPLGYNGAGFGFGRSERQGNGSRVRTRASWAGRTSVLADATREGWRVGSARLGIMIR